MTKYSAQNVIAVAGGKKVEGAEITKRTTIGVKVLITNNDPIELSVPFNNNLDQLDGEVFGYFVEEVNGFIEDKKQNDPDEFDACLKQGYFYFIHSES